MADGLQMGNLSLNESQHAPQGNAPVGRAAYIPPHLRQRGPGPAPSANAGAPSGFGGPRYSTRKTEHREAATDFVSSSDGGNWANANAPNFSPRGPANGMTS